MADRYDEDSPNWRGGKTLDIVAYRKAWRAAHPNYHKEWLKKHPGYMALYEKLRPKRTTESIPREVLNPEVRAARRRAASALKHQVRVGNIKRLPCFCCGLEPTHGHHPDYSDPLAVVWLCRAHHGQLHREFKIYLVKA